MVAHDEGVITHDRSARALMQWLDVADLLLGRFGAKVTVEASLAATAKTTRGLSARLGLRVAAFDLLEAGDSGRRRQ